MTKRFFSAIALFLVALTACNCSGGSWQKTDRGIIVKPEIAENEANVPKLIRLQVEGEKIIRVSATRENKFSDPQSLVVIDRKARTVNAGYEISGDDSSVTISTASVQARIDLHTGEICFLDAAGNILLKEQENGGKFLEPYEVTQTHADGKDEHYTGWSMQTVFDSPEDEAFFGLGQHQADEWNYKGKNEELFQYNTKVSLPVVISSKNYGLLFDNYSLSRFGNPNDYRQLQDLFALKDKDGQSGALTGTYTSPEAETLVRREENIYFENLKTAKNLPDFPLGRSMVVYEGSLTPLESGEYNFSHYYSGYQKIYIDGKSVYTEDLAGTGSDAQTIWRTAWNPNARKFSMYMEKDREYDFRLEWIPDGGEAYCGLRAYAPVPEETQQKLSFWSEMGQQLDYYFMAGDNIDEVISGYRTLTGKAQIMPDWLFGYWQSRERYRTQEEILDALQGFRDRGLPIDNIVMDWNYWVLDSWGAFEFDPERFSDAKGMIDSIHSNNAKIMISCWPKYYLTVDNFKELNDKGMIYQQSVKDSLYDWLGYKYAFYDAYDPEARKIFWRQLYENLGTIGMDSWWMDASEPNIRDCTDMEYRKLLCGPTYYGSSDEFFNAYSIVNAEAIYDGQRGYETAGLEHEAKWLQENAKWDPKGYGNSFSPENKRVFLLTRNGFPSQQRYSTATWSGDIGTRWEDMKAQIPASLNFSISGIPYWSQDIGGFSVEKRYEAAERIFEQTGIENEDLREWRELNVRWHQMGMWAPIYRSHGQYPYREPWNISPEGTPAYNAIKACLELRYRLLPYIYSIAAKVHFDDYTMMRPLVMDFGTDSKVFDIAYQFMFGPSFMINPVYAYKARQREVYFPEGNLWYDFFSGKIASEGGETKTADAPYGNIPVYVRGGSVIPFGQKAEYAGHKANDVMRIYVYGGADGDFTLYEDEGVNYGYEAGRFSKILFSYDDSAKELSIAAREGEYPGMLAERKFVIVPVDKDNPQKYDPEATGIEVIYNGTAQKVALKK